MVKNTDASRVDFRPTARALAEWVEDHLDLFAGIADLCSFGDESESAVEAVLQVRGVLRWKLSWQLVELLAEDEGIEPDDYFLEFMGIDTLELVHVALGRRRRSAVVLSPLHPVR